MSGPLSTTGAVAPQRAATPNVGIDWKRIRLYATPLLIAAYLYKYHRDKIIDYVKSINQHLSSVYTIIPYSDEQRVAAAFIHGGFLAYGLTSFAANIIAENSSNPRKIEVAAAMVMRKLEKCSVAEMQELLKDDSKKLIQGIEMEVEKLRKQNVLSLKEAKDTIQVLKRKAVDDVAEEAEQKKRKLEHDRQQDQEDVDMTSPSQDGNTEDHSEPASQSSNTFSHGKSDEFRFDRKRSQESLYRAPRPEIQVGMHVASCIDLTAPVQQQKTKKSSYISHFKKYLMPGMQNVAVEENNNNKRKREESEAANRTQQPASKWVAGSGRASKNTMGNAVRHQRRKEALKELAMSPIPEESPQISPANTNSVPARSTPELIGTGDLLSVTPNVPSSNVGESKSDPRDNRNSSINKHPQGHDPVRRKLVFNSCTRASSEPIGNSVQRKHNRFRRKDSDPDYEPPTDADDESDDEFYRTSDYMITSAIVQSIESAPVSSRTNLTQTSSPLSAFQSGSPPSGAKKSETDAVPATEIAGESEKAAAPAPSKVSQKHAPKISAASKAPAASKTPATPKTPAASARTTRTMHSAQTPRVKHRTTPMEKTAASSRPSRTKTPSVKRSNKYGYSG